MKSAQAEMKRPISETRNQSKVSDESTAAKRNRLGNVSDACYHSSEPESRLQKVLSRRDMPNLIPILELEHGKASRNNGTADDFPPQSHNTKQQSQQDSGSSSTDHLDKNELMDKFRAGLDAITAKVSKRLAQTPSSSSLRNNPKESNECERHQYLGEENKIKYNLEHEGTRYKPYEEIYNPKIDDGGDMISVHIPKIGAVTTSSAIISCPDLIDPRNASNQVQNMQVMDKFSRHIISKNDVPMPAHLDSSQKIHEDVLYRTKFFQEIDDKDEKEFALLRQAYLRHTSELKDLNVQEKFKRQEHTQLVSQIREVKLTLKELRNNIKDRLHGNGVSLKNEALGKSPIIIVDDDGEEKVKVKFNIIDKVAGNEVCLPSNIQERNTTKIVDEYAKCNTFHSGKREAFEIVHGILDYLLFKVNFQIEFGKSEDRAQCIKDKGQGLSIGPTRSLANDSQKISSPHQTENIYDLVQKDKSIREPHRLHMNMDNSFVTVPSNVDHKNRYAPAFQVVKPIAKQACGSHMNTTQNIVRPIIEFPHRNMENTRRPRIPRLYPGYPRMGNNQRMFRPPHVGYPGLTRQIPCIGSDGYRRNGPNNQTLPIFSSVECKTERNAQPYDALEKCNNIMKQQRESRSVLPKHFDIQSKITHMQPTTINLPLPNNYNSLYQSVSPRFPKIRQVLETPKIGPQRKIPSGLPHVSYPGIAADSSASQTLICAWCKREAFYLCLGCRKTAYCCVECQNLNWDEHIHDCYHDNAA